MTFSSDFQQLLSAGAFTVAEAFCSTLVALAVGIPAAFFTANRRFWGRRFLLSLSSVPLCVPPLLIALGYVSFFGMSGTLNTVLMSAFSLERPPVSFLYSFAGIVVAQGFYNFPIVMSGVHDSWSALPRPQADAARLLGAGEFRVFRTVTFWQLLPSVVSSSMLVFLYSFFSFLIVLLFGRVGSSTLEVELFKAARASLDFSRAYKIAAIETSVALFVVFSYAFLARKSNSRGISFVSGTFRRGKIRAQEFPLAVAFFLLVALFFFAPLFSIAVSALTSSRGEFTLSVFARVFSMKGFFPSLVNTVFAALFTGICSTLVAFLYASLVRTVDSRGKSAVLSVLPMVPMALSSVVVGFFLTLAVRRGNPALLVVAQVFLGWPVAFRCIYAELSRLPQETVESALVFSSSPFVLVRKIYIPSSWRGIMSAAGFCFAISAGDATLPLVMAVPHFDTLSLFTYRLAGSYRYHESCACGIVLGGMCMAVFALSNWLKARGGTIRKKRSGGII